MPGRLVRPGNDLYPRTIVIGAASETAAAHRGFWARRRAARARRTSPNLRRWTAPGFAGPATVLYVALVFLPLVLALSYSLTNKNLLSPQTAYVGFGNYRELLSDTVFKQAVKVTAIMTALIVFLPNALGL